MATKSATKHKCDCQTIPAFNEKPNGIPTDNEARRIAGSDHMASAIIYWLSRNDWSHPNMETLAEWALNEPGTLHTSQISHIRNGRLRMLGVKSTDALAAINLAVWAYKNDRQRLKALGCGPITANIETLIRDAESLTNPQTNCPLDVGGWINVYIGYLKLPEVVDCIENAPDLKAIAKKVGPYIFNVITTSGHDMAQARELFGKVLSNETKAMKLIAVAAQIQELSAKELDNDVKSICLALEAIDGKHRTSTDLYKALAE